MSRNFIHTSKFARSSVGKRVIDDNGCLGTITAASQERKKPIDYSIRFDDGRHTIVDEKSCREYLLNYEKGEKEMEDELKDPGTAVKVQEGKTPQIYEPAMKMQQAIGLFDQIMKFTKEAMKEGINGDFATIPGTNKPTLLKPGAEKLMIWFNLVPDPFITQTEKIPEGDGFILSVDTTIILRDKHGNIRGQCQANCNSGEDKYREQTRWLTEKKLKDQGLTPEGLEHQDRKSKYDNGPKTYRVYKVISSSNAYQLLNTLKKMSQKRAYVGAIIQATATSGIFTQDMEDSGDKKPEDKPEKKAEPGALNNQREKAHVLLKKCIDADTIKENARKTWEDKIADAKSDKAIQAVISSLQTFADQK